MMISLSRRQKDITGHRFGHLVALHPIEVRAQKVVWHCLCDCGGYAEKASGNMTGDVARGRVPACEDCAPHPQSLDRTGEQYGRLTVIERLGSNSDKKALWLCSCDCGGICVRSGPGMKNPKLSGCDDCTRERISLGVGRHFSHGTRLHRIWIGMNGRCRNPKNRAFPNYGGKGVTVCDAWRSYNGFSEWALSHGYTDDLTIDRVKSSEGYSPENCEWVTLSQNSKNMWASMTPDQKADFCKRRNEVAAERRKLRKAA